MNEEYREGYTAYHYHLGPFDNPYEQKSEPFKTWARGWYKAEDDDAILQVDSHFTR